MSQLVFHKIDDVKAYDGPHVLKGVRFRALREALGVTAWGMNVLELDPFCDSHPEHDHKGDGQEEVYLVLQGTVFLRTEGQERALGVGEVVRVPPTMTRKLITRDAPATILALGGTPGRAFQPTL